MSGDRDPAQSEACTLIVGVLTIESSGALEVERPAETVSDTVQFWIAPARRWKIRTYAIDRDVHAWDLADLGTARDEPIDFAIDHIKKHYGDILSRVVNVDFLHPKDRVSTAAALAATGLGGSLQVAEFDGTAIAFWTPDGTVYLTRSGEEA